MFKPYIMRVNGVETKIELKEVVPSPFLTMKGGKLYEGDKRFRSMCVTLAAYSICPKINMTPQELSDHRKTLGEELDRLNNSGIRMVRVLHIGGYQPTYSEVEVAWDKLDILVDLLEERNMYLWYNIQHRQRMLTTDPHDNIKIWSELWGTRPANIFKGEIHDLLFWDDGILDLVNQHAQKFIARYKNRSSVSIVTLVNEKTATRSKGYAPAAGLRNPPTEYEVAWFAKWHEYSTLYPNPGKKADINKFYSWIETQTFTKMRDAIYSAGYKGLINCTSFFGDSILTCLPAMRVGHIVDFHIYPENDTIQDPLSHSTDMLASRTFASIAASIHFEDMAIACSEWASVYQSGPLKSQRSLSWYTAPKQVAEWCLEQDIDIAIQYAAHSRPINDVIASIYDSFKDAIFEDSYYDAVKIFNTGKINSSGVVVKLPETSLYGSGVGSAFVNIIPGTQQEIKNMVANKQLVYVSI